MIWIIAILVVIVILFNINKRIRNKKLDDLFVTRFEKIIYDYCASEEEINNFSRDIFIYCLNKSNKNVSFDHISSFKGFVENPNTALDYASLYRSLKEAIQLATEKTNKNQVLNKYQTSKESLDVITQYVINKINRI